MNYCDICEMNTQIYAIYSHICIKCGWCSNIYGNGYVFNLNEVNYFISENHNYIKSLYKEKSNYENYFIKIYNSNILIEYTKENAYNFLIRYLKLNNIS